MCIDLWKGGGYSWGRFTRFHLLVFLYMRYKGNLNRWFVVGALAILASLARMPAAVTAWEDNVAWAMIRDEWVGRAEPLLDPPCVGSASEELAVDYFERRAATAPLDLRIKTKLGAGQWLAGRCEQAVDLWLQSALAGDLPAAFQVFRLGHADRLSPMTRSILAQYAYNYGLKLGSSEAATAWFERSFETLPLQVSASQLAGRRLSAGRGAEIPSMWRDLAAAQPESQADHWWAVAELAALDSDWSGAAQAYAKGAALSDDAYTYWMRSGSAWENAGRWEQATAAYEHARQLYPKYAWAYLNLGHANRAQQRYTEALRWYQEAQRLQPEDIVPYYYSGEMFFHLGDLEQARQQIEQGLLVDPRHGASWNLKARIAYAEGDQSEAEIAMSAALQYQSDVKLVTQWWIDLGDWWREQRDCNRAREAYEHANEIAADKLLTEWRLATLGEICD